MLNMDEKIPVKNLCNWQLGFKRIESIGDVLIPAKVTIRLPRGEVISQCQAGNRLFVGTDTFGSHARVFIDDLDTRVEVGFEKPENKKGQMVLTEDKIQSLYELKTLSTFKKNVEECVKTQAEKSLFAEYAKKLKVNDYDKIRFVEEHTGFKID